MLVRGTKGRAHEGKPRSPPVQRAGRLRARARGARPRRGGKRPHRAGHGKLHGLAHSLLYRAGRRARGMGVRRRRDAPAGMAGAARVHGGGERGHSRVVQADPQGAERALVDCGIGVAYDARGGPSSGVGARHRAADGCAGRAVLAGEPGHGRGMRAVPRGGRSRVRLDRNAADVVPGHAGHRGDGSRARDAGGGGPGIRIGRPSPAGSAPRAAVRGRRAAALRGGRLPPGALLRAWARRAAAVSREVRCHVVRAGSGRRRAVRGDVRVRRRRRRGGRRL